MKYLQKVKIVEGFYSRKFFARRGRVISVSGTTAMVRVRNGRLFGRDVVEVNVSLLKKTFV